MLRDASNIKLSTTILGEQISFPVCIAPTGMHMLAHPSGEMATAKGMGNIIPIVVWVDSACV